MEVAIITGGSKGIGYKTAEGICKTFNGGVLIASRSSKEGEKAAKNLKNDGCQEAKYHQLDITNEDSIKNLKNFIEDEYDGIKILVNNAGAALSSIIGLPNYENAKKEMDVNYYGTKKVFDILLPLFKKGTSVVNVSSAAGLLSGLGKSPASMKLREKFATSGSSLSLEELDNLMEQYLEAIKDGTFSEKGFSGWSYAMSKVGLSAWTRIQAQDLRKKMKEKGIKVNFVDPGYTATDMTIPFRSMVQKHPLSPEEGARSSICLATLPQDSTITGKFFDQSCNEADWVNDK